MPNRNPEKALPEVAEKIIPYSWVPNRKHYPKSRKKLYLILGCLIGTEEEEITPRVKKLYLILGCLIGTTDAIVNDADIKLYLILGCLIGTGLLHNPLIH